MIVHKSSHNSTLQTATTNYGYISNKWYIISVAPLSSLAAKKKITVVIQINGILFKEDQQHLQLWSCILQYLLLYSIALTLAVSKSSLAFLHIYSYIFPHSILHSCTFSLMTFFHIISYVILHYLIHLTYIHLHCFLYLYYILPHHFLKILL